MQGARRNRQGDRVTRFVFTLNNWTQEEYDYLTKDFATRVQWLIVGRETGAQGTKHLQGACILGSRMAFSKLKTLPGLKRSHIEVMHGKPEQSRTYCSKEDSNPFEHGTLPSPGKRSDIHNVVARIQGGEKLRSLAKDEEGGVGIVKFHKGLTVLSSFLRPKRTAPPKIFWLYGPTGTGKTRLAYKAGRRLAVFEGLPFDDIWISAGNLRWFDGYDGQVVAIIDDFRAKHVTSFAFFLRLFDRYPMACEFKGGFVEWTPKYIFVTCPYTPERAFEKRLEHVPEDIAQLRRRITRVFEFNDRVCSSKTARKEFVNAIFEACGDLGISRSEPGAGDPEIESGGDELLTQQSQLGQGLGDGSNSESDESIGSIFSL